MAVSPEDNAEGVVTLTILSNGSAIDDSIDVVSVRTHKQINRISAATIVLLDGDMPEADFPQSNTDTFRPGSEIEIKSGYGGEADSLFKGVVVRHRVQIDGNNYSRLVLECRDKAAAMTIGRKNANYVEMSDSDVIKKLLANHGLRSKVDATQPRHLELVQYYCTDWDFLLSRAEANAQVVLVDDGEVTVQSPSAGGRAALEVTYGLDLIEFDADIDARTQLGSVEAVSWDPATQDVVSSTASATDVGSQGNLGAGELASVMGSPTYRLQTVAHSDAGTLSAWAKGQQVKSALARIQGHVKFQGSALAKIGALLTLKGVGDRFSGDVYVSGVYHEISSGNWTTKARFGMSPDWFAESRDLSAPPASGLLPGTEGLQLAVVKQLSKDPGRENRVQVEVPVLNAETKGVWARLGKFYGSEGIGSFFFPEIGDEVVLGYLNNDPGHPVILGSLYSSKRKPPYEPEEENNIKALLTRSKLLVEFDEEKKQIMLTTPAKNKIVLCDESKSIVLEDETGNKIEMDPKGIAMSSPKDIEITASGNISIAADMDVSVKGMNISNQANASFTAKGTGSAELSAGGTTTVKGAMVLIN